MWLYATNSINIMPWNIRVIHRSIKLMENVPPALGELNSAGFLRAKLREGKKIKIHLSHHKSTNWTSWLWMKCLWGGGEGGNRALIFPPTRACVHRLNTPLQRGLTSGQCPVQAEEQGPTSVFPVHFKIHALTLLFPYSVCLNTLKGIAAARKLNPWSHPSLIGTF